mmetsp:Transcript_2015/g.4028  ORF Transcript_2015/g.4028 Transcript_2015/m.4028 type:complete len:373 (-) Transcript_2015:1345-2463(-)
MAEPPAKRAKTLSLPPPQTLVSWCDLSPELIVRMSRYVDIGRDLTGLCVVVGSDIAARIRRAYLADNDAYLAHALALTPLLLMAKDNRRNRRAAFARAASRIRSWMAVNTNWRNRCDKLSFESVEWAYRDNDSTLSQLQPKESIGRVVMFNEDGPRALAVSFTDGAARHSVTVPVRSIFTSPMIATRLGLVEIVKTLIDNGFLDVNAFLPYASRLHPRMNIVCFCLANCIDNSVLRYLLSRDDFDPNIPWSPNNPPFRPVHLASCTGEADPEALEMLLAHPNCSADAADEIGKTPLHSLCQFLEEYEVAKMKVLLAHGANPEAQDNEGNTPFDYLVDWLRRCTSNDDVDLVTELLAVLQKAIIARNHQDEND